MRIQNLETALPKRFVRMAAPDTVQKRDASRKPLAP